MKAWGGEVEYISTYSYPCSRWTCVALLLGSFTTCDKAPQYLFNARLSGPEKRSGRFGDGKSSIHAENQTTICRSSIP